MCRNWADSCPGRPFSPSDWRRAFSVWQGQLYCLRLHFEVLISIFRVGVFYAVRRYLLHSLYHDLQELSEEPPNSSSSDDVELETLPTPSTAGVASRENPFPPPKRALHSTFSRAIFALSFSESSMLFVLLMCQALDIFQSRYVQ